MAEIFDPKLMIAKRKNIWQKHGFKIVLIFTAIILLISGYLIYNHYLSPNYELYQLLPKNYDISFELKTDRFTFPKTHQKQLLENQALGRAYQKIVNEVQDHLQIIPSETQNYLNNFKHLLFFVSDSNKFGLIGKIPDKKTGQLLADISLPGWQTDIIKNQIFVAANDPDLLKEMVGQRLSSGPLPYFSFTISPWLKVGIRDSFFDKQYPSQALTNLQQILWPLSLAQGEYSLELNSGYKFLEFFLTPNVDNNIVDSPTLNDWLIYLPKGENSIFGLADSSILAKNLERNTNLQSIFRQYDSYFWLNYQISLSNLLNNINGPVLISAGNDNWQIITKSENMELAEYYIKQFYGQFSPKTEEVTLPDGSKSTQIINNPASVILTEQETNGWQIKYVANSSKKVGFAQLNDILVISNNILDITENTVKIDCLMDDISGIIQLSLTDTKLITSELFKEFTQITTIQSNTGQIKSCLELK